MPVCDAAGANSTTMRPPQKTLTSLAWVTKPSLAAHIVNFHGVLPACMVMGGLVKRPSPSVVT